MGEPTQVIVDFLERRDGSALTILDVGCGQGRDVLFLARRGHRVLGVDISPNGIADLLDAAKREGLPAEGVVADIAEFVPEGRFDVILCDRTLHMLTEKDRHSVLARLTGHVAEQGWLLVADERRNMPGLKAVVDASTLSWTPELEKQGYLFLRRS